ncbi:DUF3488 and DUF4129 domain-containing transglutaminase family protein [Natrialbaceae archaeon A-CW2]|uniref:transglutaminase TgpA family protein n=1 Tax=Natronosalvus amylolyticus TaxID=2961994 RepID=UPI0020C9FFA7|nr:transglutaminase domain-containing protein [Natronosalvus amylolyticus]
MSTSNRRRTISVDLSETVGGEPFRLLALSGLVVLTAAYVAVLREVTLVVGGTRSLYLIVIGMGLGATVLARAIRPRTALAIGLGASVLGFWTYLEATGHGLGTAITQADMFVSDTVTLATGMELLQMLEAGIWTLAFVPAPVFLSWYLAMRERYVLSVIPGGIALLFLVLTGDASMGVTLVGVVGGISAVGFGELHHRDGSIAQADVLAIMFAVIVFLSLSVTLVPGGAASPTFLVESEPGTLDGVIDDNPDRTTITGQVDLSPEVQFSVVTEEPGYWRTGVYDRYTGDAWVRSGPDGTYDDIGLSPPAGEYDTARHTFTIEHQRNTIPVAAQPTAVEGDVTDALLVTDHGQPMPDGPLIEGDMYNVESASLHNDPETLASAGTEYPEEITEYYLQTPESTSEEFEDRTAEILEAADAETPYEKAATIEAYFQSEYDYTLDVDRPGGNAANAFLLEMDEGYCVYFATTMTQMLRAEGVPARYVTGYTTGQQVDDNEYVVRGLDAHAWVEVYFPEHGWVAFEPTPQSRDDTHQDRLEEARADGEPNVDTDASADVPADGIQDEPDALEDIVDGVPAPLEDGNYSDNESDGTPDANRTPGQNGSDDDPFDQRIDPGGGTAPGTGADDDDAGIPSIPFSSGDVFVGLAVLVGLAAGAHRSGVPALVSREVRLYWHGFREEPVTDTRRAYERLEHLLARSYRPRERGESPRGYLASLEATHSVDPRVRRVVELHERAHYAGEIDEERAKEAIDLVTELAREEAPIVGRLWQ